MTNYLDNSYGYGVNATNAEFVASVSGGSATYTTVHTDNYVGYGAAGQTTYSFIGANSDGSAQMAMWNYNNYAFSQEANYGHVWTPSGDTFTATSPTAFQIIHTVTASDGDYARFGISGSGTANVDCMSSDIGSNGLTFGQGAGCYTDASYDGVGSQIAQFLSVGNNSVNQFGIIVTGDGTTGSAAFSLITSFVNGAISVPNFAASVK
jgi:hypothetical protein